MTDGEKLRIRLTNILTDNGWESNQQSYDECVDKIIYQVKRFVKAKAEIIIE